MNLLSMLLDLFNRPTGKRTRTPASDLAHVPNVVYQPRETRIWTGNWLATSRTIQKAIEKRERRKARNRWIRLLGGYNDHKKSRPAF